MASFKIEKPTSLKMILKNMRNDYAYLLLFRWSSQSEEESSS